MAGQGLVNPLAYYTPGIPGRGAGTIFKAPDLSGVVDKFGKMKAVKDAAQAKEDDDAQKNVEKLMELKGTIDEEITKEGNEKVKTFFGEVQKEISKNDGDLSKVDMPRLKRLKWETENFLTQGTLIGKEHDDVSKKWTAMKMTDNFDDDYLDEQFKQIEAESQKPLMERRYTSILNTPKVYDFTKKTGELNKQVPKFETGTLSSPQVDAEGIMRQSGTKVSGVSTSQVLNKYTDALIYDKKWNKAFNGEYVELMKMYPQGLPVNYNSVEIDPNTKRVTVTPVSETITRPEQLLKYKAAQASYLKYEPIEKAQRPGGGGTTIINQTGSDEQAAPDLYNIEYTVKNDVGDEVVKTWSIPVKSQRSIFAYNNEKNKQNPLVQKLPGSSFSITGKKPNNNADWIVTLTNEPEPYLKDGGGLSAKKTNTSKKYIQYTAIQKGNYDPKTGTAIRQNEVENWFIDPKTPEGIQFIKTNAKPESWSELIGSTTNTKSSAKNKPTDVSNIFNN